MFNDPFEGLGAALACLRERRGFSTQTKAAESLGFDKGQLSRWENESPRPTLENLGRLMVAYEVRLADLVALLEEVRRPNRMSRPESGEKIATPGADAEGLKAAISEILLAALRGEPRYLVERADNSSYIRWGLVERDLRRAVDLAFSASAQPAPPQTPAHAWKPMPRDSPFRCQECEWRGPLRECREDGCPSCAGDVEPL
jgi:transcriptional regulator with XRE-family HTH domain